jgi:predicted transcriptional regulator
MAQVSTRTESGCPSSDSRICGTKNMDDSGRGQSHSRKNSQFPRTINGCPTLAASLFLRLGWDGGWPGRRRKFQFWMLTSDSDAPTFEGMEVQLTVEQEAQLEQLANKSGTNPEALALRAVLRMLEDDARFHAGVRAGLDDAARGNFVPTPEVWASVQRILKS